MVDTINELSNLARQLNQKSDKLNSIITEVNQKLLALNIGIEVWLKNEPLTMADHSTFNAEGEPCLPWSEATILGYAEVDDEWQLAVKHCLLADKEVNPRFTRTIVTVTNSTDPTPLSHASRTLRTKAMCRIPTLLDHLKAAAQRTVQSIEEAEKATEKL